MSRIRYISPPPRTLLLPVYPSRSISLFGGARCGRRRCPRSPLPFSDIGVCSRRGGMTDVFIVFFFVSDCFVSGCEEDSLLFWIEVSYYSRSIPHQKDDFEFFDCVLFFGSWMIDMVVEIVEVASFEWIGICFLYFRTGAGGAWNGRICVSMRYRHTIWIFQYTAAIPGAGFSPNGVSPLHRQHPEQMRE